MGGSSVVTSSVDAKIRSAAAGDVARVRSDVDDGTGTLVLSRWAGFRRRCLRPPGRMRHLVFDRRHESGVRAEGPDERRQDPTVRMQGGLGPQIDHTESITGVF